MAILLVGADRRINNPNNNPNNKSTNKSSNKCNIIINLYYNIALCRRRQRVLRLQ